MGFVVDKGTYIQKYKYKRHGERRTRGKFQLTQKEGESYKKM